MKYEFEILSYLIVLAETAFVGAIIYLLLKYTGKLLRYFSKGKNFRRIIIKIFLVVAASIWILYLFWSINLFYSIDKNINPIFIVISSILFVVFVWLTGRDILAGIIFIIENSLEVGQNIYSSLAEGKIKKIGVRTLSIECESGKILILPYTKLLSEKISIIRKENRFNNYDSEILIQADESPVKIREIIFRRIILSHFASIFSEPKINYIDTVNGLHRFKITASTIREDHFHKILFDINKFYEHKIQN